MEDANINTSHFQTGDVTNNKGTKEIVIHSDNIIISSSMGTTANVMPMEAYDDPIPKIGSNEDVITQEANVNVVKHHDFVSDDLIADLRFSDYTFFKNFAIKDYLIYESIRPGRDAGDNCDEQLGWGYRHQQCFVLFFCVTIAYSMRSCMGVSLVAMVERTNVTAVVESNIITREIHKDRTERNSTAQALLLVPPYPQFQWNKKTQDVILSSFFWGYMLLQIPAGQLIHIFGARFMLTMALLINGVAAVIFPWATYYGGWPFASLIRIIQGLSQACIFPGMHSMFGKWTPLEERGRLAGYAYGGQALGLVIGLPITGYISASPLGWPGVFRFYGLLSCISSAILWWLCADSPAKHSKISERERLYIEKNLGMSGFEKKPPVPWCQILKSPGLYAIMMAHIGQNFAHVTIYSEIPAFMDKIMNVNIKANGLLTALPFLVMFFANFFFSWLTDMLIVKKILSVTNTRKLANSLGSVPVALGLVVLALVPKNMYVVETLLMIICSFKIASHLGFQMNHIDMSSNYSGTLMSITNFASNLVASLAPITAGFILKDVTSEAQWCTVFYVSAAFLFFSNVGYVLLGTSKKADWDIPKDQKKNGADLVEMERFIRHVR